MEKIDISKILKDCPNGMELDCAMCKNVTLNHISESCLFPIKIDTPIGEISLSKYGCFFNDNMAKCVIFPKGKTTWEGFHRPFKDGDIVATENGLFIGIIKIESGMQRYAYVSINDVNNLSRNAPFIFERLATEKEKQELFDAIKSNGYKWNSETKTLEKLVEPKFKVGDKIVRRNSITNSWIVDSVTSEYYGLKLSQGSENIGVLPVSEQDEWELFPKKFDITTLKPFDKVLVRDNNRQKWTANLFSLFDKSLIYPYSCVGYYTHQCIPYEGNEHLLGTSNDCDDFYKTWEN